MGIRVVALPIAGPPQVDSGPIIGQLWPGRCCFLLDRHSPVNAYSVQHSLPHCPSGRGQCASLSVDVFCYPVLRGVPRLWFLSLRVVEGWPLPVLCVQGPHWSHPAWLLLVFRTADLRDQSSRLQMAQPTCSNGGCGSYLQ